jgi:hypothetical protein
MSWNSDLEPLTMLAKDRRAEMVAFVERERLVKQNQSGQEHKHSAWQWLRMSLLSGLQRGSRLEPSSTPRSLLQS